MGKITFACDAPAVAPQITLAGFLFLGVGLAFSCGLVVEVGNCFQSFFPFLLFCLQNCSPQVHSSPAFVQLYGHGFCFVFALDVG